MSKRLLNEAEQFLLENWEESRLLEEAMQGVRTKYNAVFQRIVDAVTERHPELDANAMYPTQFWDDGLIGFGRRSWPAKEARWPSGFWVDGLRLELLTAEASDPPGASIWFSRKAKSSFDLDRARIVVGAAAKELLSRQELEGVSVGSAADDVLLFFPAPTKSVLLSALAGGDGEEFVALFVTQLDLMARFVPVLDKVFRECVGSA